MPDSSRNLWLEQDLDFQRREWSFQRAGRIALLLFVLASALGLFGEGPLSHTRVQLENRKSSRTAIWIEYDRFLRVSVPTRLSIRFAHPVADSPIGEVSLSRPYFDLIRIQRIDPEPDRIILEKERVRLLYSPDHFPVGNTIHLDFEPLEFGPLPLRIQAARTEETVALSQFVYF